MRLLIAVAAAVLLFALAPPANAQSTAVPTITSASLLSVDEGTTAIVSLTAEDTDTTSDHLMWTRTGGADSDKFSLSSAGVLTFAPAKDFESPDDANADGTYEVTVQVSDGANTDSADLLVTVDNVTELLAAITGPNTVTFAENAATRVATFTASSDSDREGVEWTIGGTDAAHFSIDSPAGALRFDIDPVSPNLWAEPPDFEEPADADDDNEYSITLQAQAGTTTTPAVSVTITVTDVDEPGDLSLSSTRPRTRVALTATLTDLDGATSGTTTWKWERSAGRNAWAVIDGATAASYTPVAADTPAFLRVTATYDDEHGTGKTVSEVAPNVVTGPLLTGLTAETEDSRANSVQALYPAFDPQTLHYGIGCNSTDTMVLTVSAAANARVAVDGVQAGSAPMSVAVAGDSDVAIRVTEASGAATTYVVHCLSDDFFKIETHTFPGADPFEDLILLNRRGYFTVMDRNGVPRYHRAYLGLSPFAIRFYRIGADGAYRYGFGQTSSYTILDEDFEVVADGVRTVAPLNALDFHDFQILEDSNYLVMSYEPATRDFSDIELPPPADVGVDLSSLGLLDSAFQIVTPSAGAAFTWNSWGNIAIEDCVSHFFPVTLSTDPDARSPRQDYAHINGMHVVDGVLAASLRGCSKVLGIDVEPGATRGDVLWRMGRTNLSDAEWAARDIGPRPLDFINDPEGEFCGQHTARFLPTGNILLYDNGVECAIDPWTFDQLGREGNDFSRAVEYALDLDNHEAVFVRDHSLRGERAHVGYASGNVDALDNGDWLVSWGRVTDENDRFPDNEMATLVDPATGQEKLGIRFAELPSEARIRRINPTVAPAEALAPQPVPLTAEFPDSINTSIFHTGAADAPQVVVAFSRPVVDFDETSPSLSVTGASIASVSPHILPGEPANAYLVTLTPDGDGAITISLVADQPCGSDGICAAAGTVLSAVPVALVIRARVHVSFAQAAYSVREGSTLAVTVRLGPAHRGVRGVTVPVMLDPSSHDDLTAGQSVTFAAGETSKVLLVEALDDDLVEGAENVTLEFGTLPHGITAGSTASASVTVTDPDQAQFSSHLDQLQVAEGGEVAFTYTITNGVTFEDDQTVALSLSGNATPGDDFTLEDENGQTLTDPYEVTFPSGESSVSVTIRAVDDSDIEEAAETVTVSAILASTGGPVGAAQTLTIPPSDVPDTPEVSIAAGSTVTEGEDATFTLWRTASSSTPFSEPLVVSLEATDTGSALDTAPPTTARFEGGEVMIDVLVPTLDDRVVEPAGEVTLLIRGSTSNPPVYLTGAVNAATVTVSDNDTAAFTLTGSAEEVAEGRAVTVKIAGDGVTFAEPQTFTLALGGTATPLDDFTVTAGGRELSEPYTVTLPARAKSVTVTVQTIRDGEDDVGETVELSASHDGTAIGAVAITIAAPAPPIIGGGGGGGGSGPSPSTVDFEWTVKRDIEQLAEGNDTPTGMWADSATLWLADNPNGSGDAVYAYDRRSGERQSGREFALHTTNRAPRGIWSRGEGLVWISDSGRDRLFAYSLQSGQPSEEHDIELAEENGDARGIWSDGETMWVLNDNPSLFAYDLETGALLARFALDPANRTPVGIWSDRVTIWVSDPGSSPRRLFAYRLPTPAEVEAATAEASLERVPEEDFAELSNASNNSPGGIWSDGEVMYVADESDGKVYTYNMPDTIDARLASLTLSGVEFGEFDPGQTDYAGVIDEGVTETVVAAEAMQRRTDIAIDPPDADEAAEGHQVALEGIAAITVTVTSADGSREKTYRVTFGEAEPEAAAEPWEHCLLGDIAEGFSLVVFEGGSVEELVACAESRDVVTLYALHEGAYLTYILGAPDFVNEGFREPYPDGVPALTALIAGSNGPPSEDPVGGTGVPRSWSECLRGDVAEGFSLVIYEGGSVEELESCAVGHGVTAVYTLAEGEWLSYILGAPDIVNQPFRELFPEGLPSLTPLVAKSEDRASTAADGGGAVGN